MELEAYISEKGDVVRADVVAGPTLFRAAAEECPPEVEIQAGIRQRGSCTQPVTRICCL